MTKKGYQKRLPTVLPSPPRHHPPVGPTMPRPREARESGAPPPARAAPAAAPLVPAPRQPPQPVALPAPDAAPAPRSRLVRRVTLLLVAVGVALAAIVSGAVVWWTARDSEEGLPTAAVPLTSWPGAGASRIVTQVGPDGVLEVTHRIHAKRPIDTIVLGLPETVEPGTVEASGVEVVADGRPTSGPSLISSFRASYVLGDATRILVRYQLTGAVERSTSAPGRGLVTTTALEVSAEQPRVRRTVRSHAVLSLACAGSARAQPEPCGGPESSDQWSVELTGPRVHDRVVAQVDLD